MKKRKVLWIAGIISVVLVTAIVAGCSNFFLKPGAANASGARTAWSSLVKAPDGELVPSVTTNTPTLIVASYAHPNKGGDYERAWSQANFNPENPQFFEGGNSPKNVWDMVPEDLKPYTILSIHPNFMWGRGDAKKAQQKRWIEDQLGVCQKYKIPVIIVMQSAWTWYYCFNTIYPYSGIKADEDWIDMIVEKYPVLVGFNATEEHHEDAMTIADRVERWTRYCAEKSEEMEGERSLTFYLFDSHSHFMEYPKHPAFKATMKKYGKKHFVYGWKDTLKGNWHTMYSHSLGAWLNDYAAAFGGLIDTWTWNMRGWTEVFSARRGSYGDNWYQTMSYPEGYMFLYMMQMYLNGATVYNFEIPFHVYGASLDPSDGFKPHVAEMMENVFVPFFRWMLGTKVNGFDEPHLPPTKTEMFNRTKIVGHGTGQNFLPKEMWVEGDGSHWGEIETYKTGRYGMVPMVFSAITDGPLYESGKVNNSANSQTFQQQYPKQTIDLDASRQNKEGFAAYSDHVGVGGQGAWFLYNSWCNPTDSNPDVNRKQWVKIPLGTRGVPPSSSGGGGGKSVEVEMTPHTGIIIKEINGSKIEVFMSNYRIYKDHIFQAPNYGLQGDWQFVIPNMTVGGKYTEENILKGRTGDSRKTTFRFSGTSRLTKDEVITQNNIGKSSVKVSGNTVTVNGNGWTKFTIEYE